MMNKAWVPFVVSLVLFVSSFFIDDRGVAGLVIGVAIGLGLSAVWFDEGHK